MSYQKASEMKKVLIIGFIERLRYGGGRRQLPLAKYLPEFGRQPTFITPPPRERPNIQARIVETPYHDILGIWRRPLKLKPDDGIRHQVRKRFGVTSRRSFIDFLMSIFGAIVCYPDEHKGWKPFAFRAGNELLQQENFDAMISCMPVTCHIVARELKDRHKIPWIVDLTDLWSQNHNYQYGQLRRWFDARLELKTLSSADALVTVSQPLAEKLGALHKGKSVYTITHGFDPAKVNNPPKSLTNKFTITYTGSIYNTKQETSKLLHTLSDLLSERVLEPSSLEVRFYGPKYAWLDKESKQYGLLSIVKQHGQVSRQIALARQRESQLLLLLKWEDPAQRGVYSGKIFEYLAARRPILATGGYTDVVTELLNETKAGIEAPTTQDIKDTLAKLYQEYKSKGEVAYQGVESEINKYSHHEMAGKFATILNHLTGD